MTSRLDERGPHPVAPHRDAVRDGNGVELHRRATGGPDTCLYLFCEPAQVEVAGTDLDPRVGDPDDRPSQRLVVKPDRLEHGARGSSVRAIGDGGASLFAWHRGHGDSGLPLQSNNKRAIILLRMMAPGLESRRCRLHHPLSPGTTLPVMVGNGHDHDADSVTQMNERGFQHDFVQTLSQIYSTYDIIMDTTGPSPRSLAVVSHS